MKHFVAIINGNDERYLLARDEDHAYDQVYLDIGYDPGEVYVEQITEEEWNDQ
jgi:hypothetical protein